MSYSNYSSNQSYERTSTNFMYKVYGWMSAGLLMTATTAYGVYANPPLFNALIMNKVAFYMLLFAPIGLVLLLGAAINRMSFGVAAGVFTLYSCITGITLSTLFMAYTMESIYMVFALTSSMFFVMSVYGYLTNADLSSAGNLLIMGLWGIIISSFINIFMGSDTFQYIISFIAVIIFTGLIAYDTQKIKHLGDQLAGQGQPINKIALLGALVLYLDFINLFLNLMYLLGNRRRD